MTRLKKNQFYALFDDYGEPEIEVSGYPALFKSKRWALSMAKHRRMTIGIVEIARVEGK